MIPELGLLSLVIALMFSILSASVPCWPLRYRSDALSIKPWLYAQTAFVLLAYALLTALFITSDFTVLYVAENSSRLLPWYYRMTAVWGAHEGSILLWVTILSLWILVFTARKTVWEGEPKEKMLSVLSFVQAGFLAFIIFTSNPFLRYFESKLPDGQDLNPLLQDPGFLIHPPILYTGYVGFAIAFAVAFVALLTQTFNQQWARALRIWTQVAWAFLTLGIMLGSWWAYRELGWGGFWFWDPVENASFMPWLTGTALLHSLVVSEKRGQFYSWSLLLALITFSLSLLGTFLVRSGVLTSVHAFASDPARGIYILAFLSIIVFTSLSLFAAQSGSFSKPIQFEMVSKETALLSNNLILFVLMSTVLLGTLYPLMMQMLNWGKLSVGAPYFNAIFAPMMAIALALMTFGARASWREDSFKSLCAKVKIEFALALLACILLAVTTSLHSMAFMVGVGLSVLLIASSLWQLKLAGRGFPRILPMVLAHIGVAVTALGIIVNMSLNHEADVAMSLNDVIQIGPYQAKFVDVRNRTESNFDTLTGTFQILDSRGKLITSLEPEKRYYRLRRQLMTDAAIYTTPFRDIYIALGNELSDGRYGVRLYDKPFIRWIWTGCLLMVLGIMVSLYNRSEKHVY